MPFVFGSQSARDMSVTPLLTALLALSLGVPNTGAESACFSDAPRVCPHLEPGDAEFLDCLRERWIVLSPACQHDMKQVDRLAAEFQASCRLEVLRWCHDAPRGGGRVLTCLNDQATLLSSGCAQSVAIALEKVDVIAKACSTELKKHCPGVPPRTGRRFVCLKSKDRVLSSRCREALRL
jgi:hypothetical protein